MQIPACEGSASKCSKHFDDYQVPLCMQAALIEPESDNVRDNRVAGVDCPFQSRPAPRLRFIALLFGDVNLSLQHHDSVDKFIWADESA